MCVIDGLVSHQASEWKAKPMCTFAIRVRLFHGISYHRREETMSSSADIHRVIFQSVVARVAAAAAACASECVIE